MKNLFLITLLISTAALSDEHDLENSESIMVSDLTVEEFRGVVTTIVQQVLENCSVEGDMEGKAKLNFKVVGEVTGKMVCETLREE
mgnify:CR=1 FL=1